MTRLFAITIVLALAATACRAPGQPPRHPDDATYRDLIRREVSTAGSALGSAELVLAQARAGKITVTYAQVGLRQCAADLEGVATDLAEVTPPPERAAAQRGLDAIATHDGELLRSIADRWPGAGAVTRAQARAAADARRVGGSLSRALGA